MLGKFQLLASFIVLATISNALAIQNSADNSLMIYEQYYDFGQGGQYASGPVQFEVYGSEPSYLILDGQSRPYDSNHVPSNSLWIQGRTSWTDYIKCPLNARFRMLAYSNGGPTTMIETYPDGYQDVQQYQFYQGYTQLVFLADEIGRHTMVFYGNGQQSNEVVVDVVSNGRSSYGTVIPPGQPKESTVIIDIGASDRGFGQPQGKSCDITGAWKFAENTIIYYPNGRIEAINDRGELIDAGTWYIIDASRRQYGISWQSGWRHTHTLSADCSSLDSTGVLNGRTSTTHGTRVTSGSLSGIGDILIDSVDQGFDPTASVQGYDDPYGQLPEILIDSIEDGFDPTAPPLGELI